MSNSNNEQYNEQYTDTEKELIKNINSLDLCEILKNFDNLSYDFVFNYILNDKYQKTRKEKAITLDTVANYQPHLILKIKKILLLN
jgi:hypothetical protein